MSQKTEEKLFQDNIGEEEILENLKLNLSEEVYEKWVKYFIFESITKKKTIIRYSGEEPFKEFKKKHKKEFIKALAASGICSKKIKFLKDKKQKKQKTVKEKRKGKKAKVFKFFFISLIFVAFTVCVLTLSLSYIANRNFAETFYSVSSIKADNNIRVIQISDLHSASYGTGNEKLINRIKALKPDIIIYTGDCLDSEDNSGANVLALTRALSSVAPSYYIYGNNEVEKYYDVKLSQEELDRKFGFTNETREPSELIKITDEFEKKIEASGTKVLKNEFDTIKVGKTEIDIYGVLTSNPSAFWSYSGESFDKFIFENTNHLKIMAIHEPFVFQQYSPDTFGDLLICGHTHGGTFKVPVLGPLYTHEGGLFPQRNGDYVYGRYDVCGSPLIVSSGLENKNPLRINNKPELVVIDISRF